MPASLQAAAVSRHSPWCNVPAVQTAHSFGKGLINGREYRLENVQERFVGMRFADLDMEDRRRLDDSIIHATVVRQDEPSQDQSSIYIIFERLNAGGVNLQPQRSVWRSIMANWCGF